MNLTLEDKTKSHIYLDYYGNIYLEYNNKYYNFMIDGLDNLSLDEYNFIKEEKELILDFDNIQKLNLVNKEISLKDRVINKLEQELEDEDNYVDDEYFEEDEEYNNIKKYLQEDLEYIRDFEKEENYNFDNEEVIIYTNSVINKLYTEEIDCPLYDCLIYNEELILKTEILNMTRIYRINIHMPNSISFRPIGQKEKTYKVTYLEEKLILEEIIK